MIDAGLAARMGPADEAFVHTPGGTAASSSGAGFGEYLGRAADTLARALGQADAAAAGIGQGGDIATASVARAKADVGLEIAAVAASRVSAAVTTLLQTQG